MDRKLREVEELPDAAASDVLALTMQDVFDEGELTPDEEPILIVTPKEPDEVAGPVGKCRRCPPYRLELGDVNTLVIEEDLRAVCVFNPPVTGREVHDENGVYPLLTEDDD
jgi:hypothetical protein